MSKFNYQAVADEMRKGTPPPTMGQRIDEYSKSFSVYALADALEAVGNRSKAPKHSIEPPHSRACGWAKHEHGFECSYNCPTCHGLDTRGLAK